MKPSTPQRGNGLTLGELALPITLAVIIGAAMATQVWIHQQTISLAYAISDLRSANAQLHLQRTSLELELAGLKSPRQLITAAEVVHDLHPPRANQIITTGGR